MEQKSEKIRTSKVSFSEDFDSLTKVWKQNRDMMTFRTFSSAKVRPGPGQDCKGCHQRTVTIDVQNTTVISEQTNID